MNVFSNREQAVIKIIGRKKLTLDQIASDLFKNNPNKPFDTTITVANSVRRIIKKCSHYNLEFTLKKIRKDKKLFIFRVKN